MSTNRPAVKPVEKTFEFLDYEELKARILIQSEQLLEDHKKKNLEELEVKRQIPFHLYTRYMTGLNANKESNANIILTGIEIYAHYKVLTEEYTGIINGRFNPNNSSFYKNFYAGIGVKNSNVLDLNLLDLNSQVLALNAARDYLRTNNVLREPIRIKTKNEEVVLTDENVISEINKFITQLNDHKRNLQNKYFDNKNSTAEITAQINGFRKDKLKNVKPDDLHRYAGVEVEARAQSVKEFQHKVVADLNTKLPKMAVEKADQRELMDDFQKRFENVNKELRQTVNQRNTENAFTADIKEKHQKGFQPVLNELKKKVTATEPMFFSENADVVRSLFKPINEELKKRVKEIEGDQHISFTPSRRK